MIDLHVHTTASDGRTTPAMTVSFAARRGVTVMAVTDHNTMSGIPRAVEAGMKYGVTVIPGIELDTRLPDMVIEHGHPVHDSMHVVGLFVGNGDNVLAAAARDGRRIALRNERVMAALGQDGMAAFSLSASGIPKRYHLKRSLVMTGKARDMNEADRLLSEAGADTVKRMPPSCAISAILADGGVPVLAHPVTLGMPDNTLFRLLVELRMRGLVAVEAFHPKHSPKYAATIVSMAKAAGLAVSGGTDFHGPDGNRPMHPLGTCPDGSPIPRSVLETLVSLSGNGRRSRPSPVCAS